MATSPFGIVLETALKHDLQGGKLETSLSGVVKPQFYCCISGNTVGVAKDPAAVMSLSATRVCTGVAITVTYSRSWSPSSTLNSWEVDWGDGNISTGAWPGAGSVAHPGGGYSLPGHYHVVLTVTDLLGATSEAEITVEILDCTTPAPIPPGPGVAYPPVALMGGCGASGPWYTANAGLTWASSGGGILDGVLIYDIKSVWSTLGGPIVKMWAATELGVYKGERNITTGTSTWTNIATMPIPTGSLTMPTFVSVACGRFGTSTVFVLAHDNVNSKVWLYRTLDEGVTWNYIQLSNGTWREMDGGLADEIWSLQYDGTERMYAGGWFLTGGGLHQWTYWNEAGGWHQVPEGSDEIVFAQCRNPNNDDIYAAGSLYNPADPPAEQWNSVAKYDGFSVTYLPHIDGLEPVDNILALTWQMSTGHIWAGGYGDAPSTDHILQYYDGTNWIEPGLFDGYVYALASDGDDVYVGGTFHTVDGITCNHIVKWNGSSWEAMGTGTNASVSAIAIGPDHEVYVGGGFGIVDGKVAPHIARWQEGEWFSMGENFTALNNSVYTIVVSEDGIVYAGGAFTQTIGGTILNRVARWDTSFSLWRPVGVSGFDDYVYALAFDSNGILWAGGEFTQADGIAADNIAWLADFTITVPTVGYSHLLDIDATGQYLLVGLLDSSGFPFVLRVPYGMQGIETVYNPGAGTWAGVACDPYYGNIAWAYGDFGAEKVVFTQDYGQTWLSSTDPAWGGGEIVRPLLISYWDTGDTVAVLNSALQVWQTKDYGATWGQNGTVAFACGCGTRDYWEPLNVWIGRAVAGANHLQYSPNAGVNWREHSTGFPAAAPVNALQVIA